MEQDTNEDWITLLSCPYCKEVIVIAQDFSMLPDDMSDEEREEITCTEAGWDDMDGRCPHLAILSDWAYAGHNIVGWNKELYLVAEEVLGHPPETDNEVARAIVDSMGYEEEFKGILDRVLPCYQHSFLIERVEKFDGLKGGGPTYYLLFLDNKKKPK